MADKSDLLGNWVVESVHEQPVIDDSPAVIQFTEDDRVAGNASCNRFTGGYKLSASQLSFSQIASTRMACPNPLMEQEQRFLAALSQVAQVQIQNETLTLQDADGNRLFRASRREETEESGGR